MTQDKDEYHKVYSANHYQRYKDQYSNNQRKRRKRNKEAFLALSPPLLCAVCKETAYECLDFHHVNPKEKEYAVKKLLLQNKLSTVVEEAKKCLVLCANCHRKHHAKNLDLQPYLYLMWKPISPLG